MSGMTPVEQSYQILWWFKIFLKSAILMSFLSHEMLILSEQYL